MVARVNAGKSIKGILNYNEIKVREGVAHCIEAVGFGLMPEELSFAEKLQRFGRLTVKNQIAGTNAIHISLNFHPDENPDNQTLRSIAAAYMEKIGFGTQPYLVYRHTDAAHDHIHIATVNIKENGKRIPIHNIGKGASELARKEIEKEFGLIEAGSHEQTVVAGLKPADISVAEYGKRPTKQQISGIVTTVVNGYRYTSFKEFSDILKEYNILANRGEPGTMMYEAGGLVYQLFDRKKGEGVGVPIKSSAIYGKPTLKNITTRFEENALIRKQYRQRIMLTIDKVLNKTSDKESFLKMLRAENISANFKSNEDGFVYGITFIDKTTCCFFNGSDIGKGYGAKGILERLQYGSSEQNDYNRKFVKKLISETDFSKDFKAVLAGWIQSGALVQAFESEKGNIFFKIGHIHTNQASFLPADEKMTRYFQANKYDFSKANTIVDFVLKKITHSGKSFRSQDDWHQILSSLGSTISNMLQQLWEPTYDSSSQPYELLREARKRRRRKSS